jgi:predicted Zn finger-like uncharacterized protein
MFTRCAHCASVFRVTLEQLQSRGGQVRCGICEQVFDAFPRLSATDPRTPEELAALGLSASPRAAPAAPPPGPAPATAPASMPTLEAAADLLLRERRAGAAVTIAETPSAATPEDPSFADVGATDADPAPAMPAAADRTADAASTDAPIASLAGRPVDAARGVDAPDETDERDERDAPDHADTATPDSVDGAGAVQATDAEPTRATVRADATADAPGDAPGDAAGASDAAVPDSAVAPAPTAPVTATEPAAAARVAFGGGPGLDGDAHALASAAAAPVDADHADAAAVAAGPPVPAATATATAPTFTAAGALALEPTAASVARRRIGAVAIAALLIAATAQGLWLARGAVAQRVAVARGPLVALCDALGCVVPLPQLTDQLSIEASSLQAVDARQPQRVRLDATLRNRATVAQAWPLLELTLTDARDAVAARRVFAPSDYLQGASPPAAADAGFPADGETVLRLVLDTGPVAPSGYRLFLFHP